MMIRFNKVFMACPLRNGLDTAGVTLRKSLKAVKPESIARYSEKLSI